ncbi:Erythrocyte band 7 integral membrane protein [Liparis tanakae]|uniref:Erythrocyte band 7 integral membrane protein n=1 Tax=Liparis tanakae TaxID=230148 RepID=A0A4Z2G7Y3_9TELE|nr:Erythrocyte band 7 integral membrane protein [Liparis tanakae]
MPENAKNLRTNRRRADQGAALPYDTATTPRMLLPRIRPVLQASVNTSVPSNGRHLNSTDGAAAGRVAQMRLKDMDRAKKKRTLENSEYSIGLCGWVLVAFSILLMLLTLPISVWMCIKATLDDATDDWGIKVERVEIKDVKLPVQLQRAMAAEAEASREARAKVIAAEGEMNASRALKEASLVIAESPSGLQLRYLQTLSTIAAEKNSTIIFPLPLEMMRGFIK